MDTGDPVWRLSKKTQKWKITPEKRKELSIVRILLIQMSVICSVHMWVSFGLRIKVLTGGRKGINWRDLDSLFNT